VAVKPFHYLESRISPSPVSTWASCALRFELAIAQIEIVPPVAGPVASGRNRFGGASLGPGFEP
jgi:hypothetical protein